MAAIRSLTPPDDHSRSKYMVTGTKQTEQTTLQLWSPIAFSSTTLCAGYCLHVCNPTLECKPYFEHKFAGMRCAFATGEHARWT